MKDQTAFSTRFARHKDELEWLFMELYHNREGWKFWSGRWQKPTTPAVPS